MTTERTGALVPIQTKVTPETADRIDALAERLGQSRYALLYDAVMLMLESHGA